MTRAQPTAAVRPTAAEVLAEVADLADPRVLAVDEHHGDDHAVKLAKLLALLVCRPKDFDRDELDTMIREARTPPRSTTGC